MAPRFAEHRSMGSRRKGKELMGTRACRAAKKYFLVFILLLAEARLASPQSAPVPESFDPVIVNGHIIDGTGSPWYSGDVGIRAGKIAAIGNLTDAARKRTIDAGGRVVAPGFID